MRTETEIRTVESHGQLSTAHFGISANDQAHIVGILRNRLYSDKIMAVLREYGTNAWDAHVEAGIADQPIKIDLPTRFTQVLSVRDYGTGISEEDIYGVYTQYGNSTKRNSNKAVGMLGIGCKSGFAYSDVFSIISYHQGMKKTYTAFIDPSGLGEMTKLAEEPCGDETGVEIQIPTKLSDQDYFYAKAKNLYKYFNPRPIINTELPTRSFTTEGTGWALRTSDSEDTGPVAIMGNIGYPIKTERLNSFSEDLKALLNVEIDMRFPIGALSIAASREDLEYTDKTINAIKTTLELCLKELQKNLQASLAQAPDLTTARKLYRDAAGHGRHTWQSGRRTTNLTWQIAQGLKIWNGIDLSQNQFSPLHDSPEMEVRAMLKSEEKTVGLSSNRYNSYYYTDNPIIAIADTASQWVGRAAALRDELIAKAGHDNFLLLIIKFKTEDPADAKAAYDAWFKACKLEGTPVYQLSNYEGKDLSRGGSQSRAAKTSKKVFKLKKQISLHPSAPSDNFETHEADLENDKGVYIEIYAFRPVVGDLRDLPAMLNELNSIGVNTAQLDVVAMRAAEKAKLGTGWKTLKQFHEQEVMKFINANPETVSNLKVLAVKKHFRTDQGIAFANRGDSFVAAGLDPQHQVVRFFHDVSEILKIATIFQPSDIAKMELLTNALNRFVNDKKPTIDYNRDHKYTEIVTKYPLLRHTYFHAVPNVYQHSPKDIGYLKTEEADPIAQYIKLIDGK